MTTTTPDWKKREIFSHRLKGKSLGEKKKKTPPGQEAVIIKKAKDKGHRELP